MNKKNLKGTWPQALFTFFGPLLLILLFRWAFLEPFVIPSGSMIPTLLIHDHIFVQKFSFGLKLPFSDSWLIHWGQPERGEIIVFKFPGNEQVYYVKRLIGLPGDRIEIKDRQVRINGEVWPLEAQTMDSTDSDSENEAFDLFTEKIPGHSHAVRFFHENLEKSREAFTGTVPAGQYFFMGDNRDQSYDSRGWGFVPEKNLVGRAWKIWLSCEDTLSSAPFICDPLKIRWPRIFKTVDFK